MPSFSGTPTRSGIATPSLTSPPTIISPVLVIGLFIPPDPMALATPVSGSTINDVPSGLIPPKVSIDATANENASPLAVPFATTTKYRYAMEFGCTVVDLPYIELERAAEKSILLTPPPEDVPCIDAKNFV